MNEPLERDALPGGLVIASNRGPVTFQRGPDGELIPKRGAGGLVTALTHVMADTGGLWLAAAITPGDREDIVLAVQKSLRVGPRVNPYDKVRLSCDIGGSSVLTVI